jgi:hypothetical protein
MWWLTGMPGFLRRYALWRFRCETARTQERGNFAGRRSSRRISVTGEAGWGRETKPRTAPEG